MLGVVEGGLCSLDAPEAMHCALLCMLEAVEGGLYLLEVLEVLEMPEMMRCVQLCMLEVPEVMRCVIAVCWRLSRVVLFAGGVGGAGDAGDDAMCATMYGGGAGSAGGDALCATPYAGAVEEARLHCNFSVNETKPTPPHSSRWASVGRALCKIEVLEKSCCRDPSCFS